MSRHTVADFTQALGRIKARVLLMPSTTDKYFTLEEAKAEAGVLGWRCVFMPIVSSAGHRAGDPHRAELAKEREFVRSCVREFMGSPAAHGKLELRKSRM